jgi:hypothetical protein
MTFIGLIKLSILQNGFPDTQQFFNSINKDSMDLVEQFYDPSALLIDPVGQHKGVQGIKSYYTSVYENVKTIRFNFKSAVQSGNTQILFWTMTYTHPDLNGGSEIYVEGSSHIEFSPQSKKAIYHRDYFDMGQMVYEQIPVISWIIKKIKSRMIPDSQ